MRHCRRRDARSNPCGQAFIPLLRVFLPGAAHCGVVPRQNNKDRVALEASASAATGIAQAADISYQQPWACFATLDVGVVSIQNDPYGD